MAARFEVYEGGDGWRWRLIAGNGENVASGQAYASKDGAKKGVDAVKRAAAEAEVTEA
ncbi:DUF1508 domain-containing protein [Agromyces protaetiae]|uniref:DUF1508 domain-containing protein n=1 Tax=Agromyces protaetiae TaxID=2509455 RepID=A0A4P6FCX6_9MICO|nr:DUF1508 domain-containing protein [Agromyces protaetiae]QAY73754.1 DUF1508 domain-containing protein [Agromyces protaetiae]